MPTTSTIIPDFNSQPQYSPPEEPVHFWDYFVTTPGYSPSEYAESLANYTPTPLTPPDLELNQDEFESPPSYSPPSTPGTPEPGNQYWSAFLGDLHQTHPGRETFAAALVAYLNRRLATLPDRQPPEQYPPPDYQPPGQL